MCVRIRLSIATATLYVMSSPKPAVHFDGQYEYEPNLTMHETFFPRTQLDDIKEFDMIEGDIVISTYPKAGTTWMQEILYQVQTGADAALAASATASPSFRVPFMESNFPVYPADGLTMIRGLPPPRLMKSHLPAHFFNKQLDAGKAKFIIVMRNVKDSLVSYYHFYQTLQAISFTGTWDQFFDLFKAKQLLHGDWLDFNLSWWKKRNNGNILFLKYEEMKKDPKSCILNVAEFLQKPLTEEQVCRVLQHTSFENMKQRSENYQVVKEKWFREDKEFFRKGVVGDHISYFSAEQSQFVQRQYIQMCEEHGLSFAYK